MANLIQIKRSTTTAAPVSLANGEFAYSSNGDVLYIGANSAVVAIGGKRVPGTLTANQALVANSTGGIDEIKLTKLTANGSAGSAGYVLKTSGTVAYWEAPASSSFTIAGDTGSDTFNTGETLTFDGNNGIAATVTNNKVTLDVIVSGDSTLIANATGLYVNDATLSIASSQITGDIALGSNTSGNYVATITAGAGISGSSSTEGGTPTIAVVANNGIVANSFGVFAKAANGTSVDASGINVVAGVGTYTNSTGHGVLANNGIIANSTGTFVNGGSTLTVNATGVHVNSALSITDLTLSGNLTVQGTLTTIDTTTLTVKDAMIELANGNVTTDSIDIGFYGQYGSTGAKFTGLFRDATDGIYKLYSGLTLEPTTTVDISNTSYTQATLQAYLSSGGLVSNSTAVTLTANSTLAVTLTANSLSLSTPLGVASGGLGISSITSGAILVGNGTGAATVLAAGTDGYVLQSNGTSVVYSTLDGGTF